MAARRVKMTVNNRYTQPLKVMPGRRVVFTPGVDYNSILFTYKHKPTDIAPFIWARHAVCPDTGIEIAAWMELSEKPSEQLSSGSCLFKIYAISDDDSWSKTLLYQSSGTSIDSKKWVLHATKDDIGWTYGKTTLLIEATLTRQGDTFIKQAYFNHLGIYQNAEALRRDINFLKLTKRDF
jgi:hypothetical protein